jgi:hypothetical protein
LGDSTYTKTVEGEKYSCPLNYADIDIKESETAKHKRANNDNNNENTKRDGIIRKEKVHLFQENGVQGHKKNCCQKLCDDHINHML